MKEVCSLRRGWAGGSASSQPVFGRTLSVSHHLPSLGRFPLSLGNRPSSGRHSSVAASPLRCRTGLAVGRRGSGRPPPGVLRWSFCPQAQAWTLVSWCGLQYRRPGPVRASAHLSRVLVGAGVTPAVHPHRPAPLAPVRRS